MTNSLQGTELQKGVWTKASLANTLKMKWNYRVNSFATIYSVEEYKERLDCIKWPRKWLWVQLIKTLAKNVTNHRSKLNQNECFRLMQTFVYFWLCTAGTAIHKMNSILIWYFYPVHIVTSAGNCNDFCIFWDINRS